MDMRTTGNRLSLLRLEKRWSASECAYRLTLQTNGVVTPETWLSWERSTDDSDTGKELLENLEDIAYLFGVDRLYFDCDVETQAEDKPVLRFPIK